VPTTSRRAKAQRNSSRLVTLGRVYVGRSTCNVSSRACTRRRTVAGRTPARRPAIPSAG
jgi:hypothetical protein